MHSVFRTSFQKASIHEVVPRVGPASVSALTQIWLLGIGFNSLRDHSIECVFLGETTSHTTAAHVFSNFRAVCPAPLWTAKSFKNATFGLFHVSLYSKGVNPTDPSSSQPRQPVSEMTGRTVEAYKSFTFHMLEECSLLPRWDCKKYCLQETPRCHAGILSFIPLSSPTQGGTTVTVIGFGFVAELSNDVRCQFGDHLQRTQKWERGHIINSTHLTCKSSSVTVGNRSLNDGDFTVQLRVTLNGQDWSALGMEFFFYKEPRLTHTSSPYFLVADQGCLARPDLPYGGPLSGGTLLEVHNLDSLAAARLGEAQCSFQCSFQNIRTPATFVSNSRVRCISPFLQSNSTAVVVSISVSLNSVSVLPDKTEYKVPFVAYRCVRG